MRVCVAVLCATLLLLWTCVPFSEAARLPYSKDDAWYYHYLYHASYCDVRRLRTWTCGPPCTHIPTLQPVEILEHGLAGTAGVVGIDHAHERIVTVFRGTENPQNLLADLSGLQIDYSWTSSCGRWCKVHAGFQASYLSLRDVTRSTVLRLAGEYPTYQVVFTGHSLGGAMAVLAAADVQERLNALDNASLVKPVSLYTFGAPRVGNAAFATWVDGMLANSAFFRITHARDPVVRVPAPAWGYAHTTSEVFYRTRDNRSVVLCNDSPGREDPQCSLSMLSVQMTDHLYYMGETFRCEDGGSAGNTAALPAAPLLCILLAVAGLVYALG
ncbi:lipase precursor-like protein [Novymonas esmeraldas]|uniref:Lipase-like protein n=1 Tax=Novymonas esmeraldas TaxID=1808958 RepID=A0AAW0F5T2_9TRYP